MSLLVYQIILLTINNDMINQKMNNKKYILECRQVSNEDIDQLFKWTNDPLVRKNSFCNKDKIQYNEHIRWFNSSLLNGNRVIFIFFMNQEPIGQVRFDKDSEYRAEIDISVDKEYRNKGLSSDIIKIASSKYKSLSQETLIIVAHIKPSNINSLKSFQKAGFTNCKTCSYKNQQCYELTLK